MIDKNDPTKMFEFKIFGLKIVWRNLKKYNKKAYKNYLSRTCVIWKPYKQDIVSFCLRSRMLSIYWGKA